MTQWSKLNPYKIPIIIGSVALAITVVGAVYLGFNSNQPKPQTLAQIESVNQPIDLKIKGNK